MDRRRKRNRSSLSSERNTKKYPSRHFVPSKEEIKRLFKQMPCWYGPNCKCGLWHPNRDEVNGVKLNGEKKIEELNGEKKSEETYPKEYFKKVNKETYPKEYFKKIKIPGDGYCMVQAVLNSLNWEGRNEHQKDVVLQKMIDLLSALIRRY
jgi:hypothetical protein